MELKEQDSTDSSEENTEKEDWGAMISRFMKVYPSMSLNDVLDLSYPQFKALYSNIYNEKTFNIFIPYLGTGSEENSEEKTTKIKKEIETSGKEVNIMEINNIVAQMNKDWNL